MEICFFKILDPVDSPFKATLVVITCRGKLSCQEITCLQPHTAWLMFCNRASVMFHIKANQRDVKDLTLLSLAFFLEGALMCSKMFVFIS